MWKAIFIHMLDCMAVGTRYCREGLQRSPVNLYRHLFFRSLWMYMLPIVEAATLVIVMKIIVRKQFQLRLLNLQKKKKVEKLRGKITILLMDCKLRKFGMIERLLIYFIFHWRKRNSPKKISAQCSTQMISFIILNCDYRVVRYFLFCGKFLWRKCCHK